MSFGQKSVGQISFSQHVMVTSVGQNVRTSNGAVNLGDVSSAKSVKGI